MFFIVLALSESLRKDKIAYCIGENFFSYQIVVRLDFQPLGVRVLYRRNTDEKKMKRNSPDTIKFISSVSVIWMQCWLPPLDFFQCFGKLGDHVWKWINFGYLFNCFPVVFSLLNSGIRMNLKWNRPIWKESMKSFWLQSFFFIQIFLFN